MPLNQNLRKNSHVLWTISLIQDISPTTQTKSEFSEMADDILKTDTIDKTTLCLADNLQRFRLMIERGINEEEATQECQKMAAIWHNDNSNALEKLKENKKLSILRWDEFLACPDYLTTLKAVEVFYKENSKFRHNVDGRIRQELKKIKSDAKITDPIQQTDLLKRYLFEECAFQKFAASKGFNYEIYKNPFPPAMKTIKSNTDFVPPGFMGEVYFTQFNTIYPRQDERIAESMNGNNKNEFGAVFNSPKKSPILKESTNFPPDFKSPAQRILEFSEFISKTIQLLPLKEQEKAMEALMKFTTQEIIPLYYDIKDIKNTLKY